MCQALCRCSHADLAPHLRNHGHVTHGFACHGMSDTCPMHGMLCFHGATALDSCKIPICGTNFMHSHTQVYACECMKYACEGTSHKSQCMPERFRSILRMHVRTHAPPQPTPHSYAIFISMYISISICIIYSMYISMYARV